MKKKILALLLCAVLILSILPMAGAAADPVQYLAFVASSGEFKNETCTDYTVITDQTAWGTAGATTWYVASGTVSLQNVTVTGDVHLILLDGCNLSATGSSDRAGIRVEGTNSLTIYAQSTGDSMGKLTAKGAYGSAGIGGSTEQACGKITISGGSIEATGGNGGGAGIGCGDFSTGGNIIINGGSITATGNKGAAIGAGVGGDHCTVTLGAGIAAKKPDGTVLTENEWRTEIAKTDTAVTFTVGLTPVQYLAFDASSGEFKNETCTDYTVITDQTAWGTAGATTWYVASGTVSLQNVIVTGSVNLVLRDGCNLTASGGYNCPGIRVEGTNSLTIYAQSNGDSMGKLSATGGSNGAGIGGGNGTAGGTITINGGSVTANGGACSAGIGGGWGAAGGTITINGGTVTANGDGEGAGIGGGCWGNTGTITISGGTVTATGGRGAGIGGDNGNITISGGTVTANSDGGGAGIGGDTGNTITISGGTVTANGDVDGAGIGGSHGTITISGGTVTATGGTMGGAGIGGGMTGDCGTVTISGGTVTANGGTDGGAGIGCGGMMSEGGEVIISGGSISATGNGGAAAIGDGGGYPGAPVTITLGEGVTLKNEGGAALTEDAWRTEIAKSETTVTFTANPPAPVKYLDETGTEQECKKYTTITNQTAWGTAGATTWYVASGTVSLTNVAVTGNVNLILLDGCDLTATGSSNNPGIKVAGTNSLNIYAQSTGDSMGKLSATGGTGGAGIGCYDGTGGTVTINGGSVNAIGGILGPGIGSGMRGAGGNITINGGTVNAIGNRGAAGIGCTGDGGGSSSVTITITGGTVTAVGSDWEIMDMAGENTYYMGGAGIGAGCQHSSGTITISGGTVNATGGNGAAGIGGGNGGLTEMAYMGMLMPGESPYRPGAAGGTITISGGSITATGQNGAASIGGGANAEEQGTITLGVTMYDENGKEVTVDDLKTATLSMTDVPPVTVPSVSIEGDNGDQTSFYPGEAVKVAVSIEDVTEGGYSVEFLVNYDTDYFVLDTANVADGLSYDDDDTNGVVKVVFYNVAEDTEKLFTLPFTVTLASGVTITEPTPVDFTVSAEGSASGVGDAEALAVGTGTATVTVDPGIAVSFADKDGNAISGSTTQYVIPGVTAAGSIRVPDAPAAATGYVFTGWSDTASGTLYKTAAEVKTAAIAITGPVTYKATYALDVTIKQIVGSGGGYVAGYMRLEVTGVLSAYRFDGHEMYLVKTDSESGKNTFAYLFDVEAYGMKEMTKDQREAAILKKLTAGTAPAGNLMPKEGDIANDVNGTKKFDVADVRAVFNCMNVSLSVDTYMPVFLRADLDSSGAVDVDDVSAVVEALLKS